MVAARLQAAFADKLSHRDVMLAEANEIEVVQAIASGTQAEVKADDMPGIGAGVLATPMVLLVAADCASDALLLLEAVEQVSAAPYLQVL